MELLFFVITLLGWVANPCFGQAFQSERVVRIPFIFYMLSSDRPQKGGDGLNVLENHSDDFKSVIGNPCIELYPADIILQKGRWKGIFVVHTTNNISINN